MATYAIGDIQGCMTALRQLVERVRFNPALDRLWFVGDLVNRGPESLAVLRYVKDLGDAAVTVLGNHDLHLLAIAAGIGRPSRKDTLHQVLSAPDRPLVLVVKSNNACLEEHRSIRRNPKPAHDHEHQHGQSKRNSTLRA